MSYSHMTLLADRRLIEIAGPDARDFLHNLVTNNVGDAKPGDAVFAGLLTPQGKILFDFIIFVRDAETYWIDCARMQAADLLKRLSLYKLRAKIEITDRSEDYAIGAQWGDAPREGLDVFVAHYADPRYALLGERFVIKHGAQEAAGLAAAILGDAAYHSHRISLAVPQGGLDYAYGEAFPHEACYDDLHGVDFNKGCYIGQEVVSRMHHKGVAKTRIVGVETSAAIEGGGIEITADGAPVGTLGSMDGTGGIALVRLDRVETAMRQGSPLRVGDITLTVRRPAWASYDAPSEGAKS